MQPADPISAKLYLRAFLRAVWNDTLQPPIFPVEVQARDSSGQRVDFTFTRHDLFALAGDPAPPPEADVPLNASHKKVLAKATTQPKDPKKLLREAGLKPNSYGRGVLAYLVKFGKLRRDPRSKGLYLPSGQSSQV